MSTLSDQQKSIARVMHAIECIRNGKMVIMTDDEDRENEGDLILAGEFVTPSMINFMAKEARGLICLSLSPDLVDRLKLPMMGDPGKASGNRSTAFTVSIEAREGVSTGISAHDRAHTIRVAIDDQVSPDDLVVPGHVFPLKSRAGGVLERPGHTEGSVDLCRLAGLKSAAVICEIMNDDGSMARADDLQSFAQKHQLPMVTIADLVTFRLMRESLVERVAERTLDLPQGPLHSVIYKSRVDETMHFALYKGGDFSENIVDVRVHNQRSLGDVFAHYFQSEPSRVDYGMNMLKDSARGVFLYLCHAHPFDYWEHEIKDIAQEPSPSQGRDKPLPNIPMDMRYVGTGSQILRDLGVKRMRVHAASAAPLKGLSGFDLEIAEHIIMKR